MYAIKTTFCVSHKKELDARASNLDRTKFGQENSQYIKANQYGLSLYNAMRPNNCGNAKFFDILF